MKKGQDFFFEKGLEVSVEYNFFLIQDSKGQESLENDWDEQAIKAMFVTKNHAIGICTVRNSEIPVYLSILHTAPDDDFEDWDYVIETSMNISSGKIIVAGPLDYVPEIPRISLQSSGYYKVRV